MSGLAAIQDGNGREEANIAVQACGLKHPKSCRILENSVTKCTCIDNLVEFNLTTRTKQWQAIQMQTNCRWHIFLAWYLGILGLGCQENDSSNSQSYQHLPSPIKIEAQYCFQQGIQLFEDNNFAMAAICFHRVVSLTPKHIQARIQLCQAMYEIGESELATETCKKALASASDDPDMLFHVAQIYFKSNRYEDAIETLEYAIHKTPKDTRISELLGVIYMQSGNNLPRDRS